MRSINALKDILDLNEGRAQLSEDSRRSHSSTFFLKCLSCRLFDQPTSQQWPISEIPRSTGDCCSSQDIAYTATSFISSFGCDLEASLVSEIVVILSFDQYIKSIVILHLIHPIDILLLLPARLLQLHLNMFPEIPQLPMVRRQYNPTLLLQLLQEFWILTQIVDAICIKQHQGVFREVPDQLREEGIHMFIPAQSRTHNPARYGVLPGVYALQPAVVQLVQLGLVGLVLHLGGQGEHGVNDYLRGVGLYGDRGGFCAEDVGQVPARFQGGHCGEVWGAGEFERTPDYADPTVVTFVLYLAEFGQDIVEDFGKLLVHNNILDSQLLLYMKLRSRRFFSVPRQRSCISPSPNHIPLVLPSITDRHYELDDKIRIAPDYKQIKDLSIPRYQSSSQLNSPRTKPRHHRRKRPKPNIQAKCEQSILTYESIKQLIKRRISSRYQQENTEGMQIIHNRLMNIL